MASSVTTNASVASGAPRWWVAASSAGVCATSSGSPAAYVAMASVCTRTYRADCAMDRVVERTSSSSPIACSSIMPEVMIRIALDAMGGDHAPLAPVAGAVRAARAWGYEVQLVGREAEVRAALQQQGDLTDIGQLL